MSPLALACLALLAGLALLAVGLLPVAVVQWVGGREQATPAPRWMTLNDDVQ